MIASLPVLLYHSIRPKRDPITVSPEHFEAHLQALTSAGYRSVGLDEAAAYLQHGQPLPKKSVLITFDDGFLDNWVYACPLLKKYGHQAVIFAVTGLIEKEGPARPTLEDVWSGAIGEDQLPPLDEPLGEEEDAPTRRLFCNWEEARRMEQTGLIRIAAHSTRHHFVFRAPEFTGLYYPNAIARSRDRLPMEIPYGFPRFKSGPALTTRAFLPFPRLYEMLRDMIPQDPVEARNFLLTSKNARFVWESLYAIPRTELGAMESDEDYLRRVADDFRQCKEILETELGRKQFAFCWPWGQSSSQALAIGQEAGFTLFFTTRTGPNPPGANPDHVHRFKIKDSSSRWLRRRLFLYSQPLLAKLYAMLRKQ